MAPASSVLLKILTPSLNGLNHSRKLLHLKLHHHRQNAIFPKSLLALNPVLHTKFDS